MSERLKRPAFQFYPGDWLRSADLRACSVGARGLWIDMLCLMHDGTPYGYLKVGGKVIDKVNLARIVGASVQEVEGWLDELRTAHVLSFAPQNGAIFSRRMVRDERVRIARASGGKLGGNPALLNHTDNLGAGTEDEKKDNLSSNLKPTPAFAVAVASTSKPEVALANVESPATELSVVQVRVSEKTEAAAKSNGSTPHPEAQPPPAASALVPLKLAEDWWKTAHSIAATATTLGIERRVGEAEDAFEDRVRVAVRLRLAQQRQEAKQREAAKGANP